MIKVSTSEMRAKLTLLKKKQLNNFKSTCYVTNKAFPESIQLEFHPHRWDTSRPNRWAMFPDLWVSFGWSISGHYLFCRVIKSGGSSNQTRCQGKEKQQTSCHVVCETKGRGITGPEQNGIPYCCTSRALLSSLTLKKTQSWERSQQAQALGGRAPIKEQGRWVWLHQGWSWIEGWHGNHPDLVVVFSFSGTGTCYRNFCSLICLPGGLRASQKSYGVQPNQIHVSTEALASV